MKKIVRWGSRAAACLGIAACAVAVIARLSGMFLLGSFQTGTLLLGGLTALVLACLGYLIILAEGRLDHIE